MGEFARKSYEDVVTFGVNPIKCTSDNWNALVLWNCLHITWCDFIKNVKRDTKEIFDKVQWKVFNYYNENYEIYNLNTKINDAISDIKSYRQELDLYDEMKRFTQVAENVKYKKTSESKRRDIFFTPIMRLYIGLAVGTYISALLSKKEIFTLTGRKLASWLKRK